MQLIRAFIFIKFAAGTILNGETMNYLPEYLLLQTAKGLDLNDLITLNASSKSFYSILKPIFHFKDTCGVKDNGLWPNLWLNLTDKMVYSPECLQHLKRNSFLYPEITLHQIGNVVNHNHSLLLEIINKMDPQTAVNLYLEENTIEAQIEAYFKHVGKFRKISLILKFSIFPANSNYLIDINLFKLEILYPKGSFVFGDNATSLLLNMNSLKSFTLKKLSHNDRYFIRSTKLAESFRLSKITHFEIHGLPIDMDGVLKGDEVLVALLKALPSTVNSLSCSGTYSEELEKSNVLTASLQGRRITNLELTWFSNGFASEGIILLADHIKKGYLKHLSLYYSPLNTEEFSSNQNWEITSALPNSQLISLKLIHQKELISSKLKLLKPFMNAASQVPSLRSLDLSDNFIGEEGCKVISNNLGALERLTLNYNFIGNFNFLR